MSAPVIAIDAMGGDFGPHCIVPACVASLAEFPSLHLVLVGHSSLIDEILTQYHGIDRDRLHVEHAGEVVGMDERPAQALRGKPDSSMRRVLELVRDGVAQACVSAGNTGALMALSRHVLKTFPGIDRPAMITAIPTQSGNCQLLDLGANVECDAEHLRQFAVMGSVVAEAQGIARPRVALLNVGIEDIKGNQQVKQAAELLRLTDGLNFIGYIEGDALYRGAADVAVCDGFVGNILLKSSEGLAAMVAARLEAQFRSGIGARLVGALALPVLRRLRDELTPARHNGASFLGLQGIVVKSHGSADAESFSSAIRRAMLQVSENLPGRLQGRMGRLLG